MSRIVPLREATDVARVGGKAASLGRLLRVGFDVPDGFVIETLTAGTIDLCPRLADEIAHAYGALGGTVAVRSSAVAEDSAAGSMAGQFETVLNVSGSTAVLDAVRCCLASAASERVHAYASEKQIDPSRLAMAIVVQRQIAADVAGVMFTASPDDAHARQMLIDAAWGLGESVVSGRVQPDVLRVAFDDGRVIAAAIATKTTEVTAAGEQAVPADRQNRPCLDSHAVHRLWQLGRAVEAHFGAPQDIEWAITDGRLYLLQSRPITTHADAAARARVIDETCADLRQRVAAGNGPWVLHNLAETLPNPSPLTWDVIRRFMSSIGGYGLAHRSIGFSPADDLADRGFLDLIGGRIYMDTARAPRMFWAGFPFAYDADVLRDRPDASQLPPTQPTGSFVRRLAAGRRMKRVDSRLREKASGFDRRFRTFSKQVVAFVATRKRQDLTAVSNEGLTTQWQDVEGFVMDVVGRDEVVAGLAAGQALDDLRQCVAEHFWDEDAAALAGLLSSGGPADASLIADAGLYDVGTGRRELSDWLSAHGHRGVGEFDLASPRWRERPDAARIAAARLAAAGSPAERHAKHAADVDAKFAELAARLPAADARELRDRVSRARAAVVVRENAKDILMLGYDLLRDLALEAGRQLRVGDGVFELGRDELLAALATGYAPVGVIETRKTRRSAERHVRWPAFLDAAAIDDLARGRTTAVRGPALAVSAGEATGPALVVRTPDDARDIKPGYVLVCPSTDPSWTPLLAGAAAIVVECGGVLSHGAVVARELGVPAVVLADATQRFKTGDVLRVDGTHGHVRRHGDPPTSVDIAAAPDVSSPAVPLPPVGRIERRAWRLGLFAATAWGAVLLLVFLLPAWILYRPILSTFDAVLWPVHRVIGWPLTAALIATLTAAVLLLLQRRLTDNKRLLALKRRTASGPLSRYGRERVRERASDEGPLRSQAKLTCSASRSKPSPQSSPGHTGRGGQTGRLLAASLVPTALLLGPLVLLFVWLGERATPSAWALPAGSPVRVVATIDADWTTPLTLAVQANEVSIDPTTPATQSLPPLRATLEHLLALYRRPRDTTGEPWQLTVAPDPARQQAADDLAAQLKAGLPAQPVEWTLRPATGFDGITTITIGTAGQSPVKMNVTLGPRRPPSPLVVNGPSGSPVKSLAVVRPRSITPTPFFSVFGFDIGWVGVYVGVYIVVLWVLRRVLKVA